MESNEMLKIAISFLVGAALVALHKVTTQRFVRFFGRHLKKVWIIIFLAIGYLLLPDSSRHMVITTAINIVIGAAILLVVILVIGNTKVAFEGALQRLRNNRR